MTILHIDINRCNTMRHDESDAIGWVLNIEIFKAVFEIWIGW